MYTIREAAEVLGVRPRLLRKWLDAGHFPGSVLREGEAWAIPHEAVTAFLRGSARRHQQPDAPVLPLPERRESPAAEVMPPTAISLSVGTAVPWPFVQHLLLAESAQRQAWQDLALHHGQTMDVLRATLECERDEIIRLRCEVLELRDELSASRTELARRNQALPVQEWDTATRTTQPLTRAMLAVLEGGR